MPALSKPTILGRIGIALGLAWLLAANILYYAQFWRPLRELLQQWFGTAGGAP